ncbi:MAG: sugar ABC transporter permease [Chloroflexota bacterium]
MLTRRQQLLFLTPLAAILIPFLLWPALLGLFASFTNYDPYQRTSLQFVGLNNFATILRDSDFQAAIRNIIVFAIITTALELVLGISIAYALRRPFRGRSLVRFVLLLPWLVSPVANGVMWHFLFDPERGIVNFWPALVGLPHLPPPLSRGLAIFAVMAVDIWRKVPLVSFLVLPGLLAIPAGQWDHATIEGLSFYSRIRHIVVPHIRLLLLTITLLLIGDTLGTAEGLWELTSGGPGSETITPGLYSYARVLHTYDSQSGATSAWLIGLAIVLLGVCYMILSRGEIDA